MEDRKFTTPIKASLRKTTKEVRLANALLEAGRVVAALNSYTNILTEESPGHPVAFLNRALCYLALGHPSLAVVDAYRALYGAAWARESGSGNLQGRQLITYMSDVEERRRAGERWATEPTCYMPVQSPWLRCGLASLTIEPQRRRLGMQKSRDQRTSNPVDEHREATINRKNLSYNVTLKAYYRLALGLWKCGGGALDSALNIIAAARELRESTKENSAFIATSTDLEQFDALGNLILQHIEGQIGLELSLQHELLNDGILSQDAEAIKQFERLGVRGLLPTKLTQIPRELYPWDKYSALTRTSLPYRFPRALNYIVDDTPAYHPFLTPPGGNSRFNLQAIGIESWANRKIADYAYPTLPTPQKQTLSVLMWLRILAQHNAQAMGMHPLEMPQIRSLDGQQDRERQLSDDDFGSGIVWNANAPTLDALRLSYPVGDGAFQSGRYARYARATRALSKLGIAHSLIAPFSYLTVEEPTTEQDALMPWSFLTNVVMPIHCLFSVGGRGLALDVKSWDGWVLNTLAAKIDANMRIMKVTRTEQVYGGLTAGKFTASFTSGLSDVVVPGPEGRTYEDSTDLWVGCMHPLPGCVNVGERWEIPRLELVEKDEGITCTAWDDEDEVMDDV